jgi:micrococcal nuclease
MASHALAALALVALVTTAAAPRPHASPAAVLSGSVVYVVDGDTIHVRVDGAVEKVRYIGVNAPEVANAASPHGPRGHPRGPETRHHARGFPHTPAAGDAARRVNLQLVSGQHVRLELDREKRDSYKRLLAYVWVGDTMVNAEMVKRGYAEVMPIPPDFRHRALLEGLQREAREAGRGLWQPSASVRTGRAAPPHVRSAR